MGARQTAAAAPGGAVGALRAGLGHGGAAELLEDIYRELPSADFSRDVVVAARELWVIPMMGAGWSDCGTPERLEAALADSPAESRVTCRAPLAGSAVANAS